MMQGITFRFPFSVLLWMVAMRSCVKGFQDGFLNVAHVALGALEPFI